MCPVWTTPCGLQNENEQNYTKMILVHFYYGESKDSMWAWHLDPAFKFRWIKHYQSSNNLLDPFKGICWVYVALGLIQISFLSFTPLVSDFQETGSRKEMLLWDHPTPRRNFGFICAGMGSLDVSCYVINTNWIYNAESFWAQVLSN